MASNRDMPLGGALCLILVVLVSALSHPTRAAVNEERAVTGRPARLLSEWRLFADMKTHKPAEGVVPYHIATPLFTDYALKYRFIYVPQGKTARYDSKEAFAFPVGTILVKAFAYAPDLRHPERGVRWIETRLLVHSRRGWRAFPYVWRPDGTDAELKVAGARLPVSFIAPDGRPRQIRYHVPNMNQCKGCHVLGKTMTPIGPKARNLNTPHDYGDGVIENQLVHWTRLGILTGAPADPDMVPRVPAFDDERAPLTQRARAYLDVNCGHCHRLDFRPLPDMGRALWSQSRNHEAADCGRPGGRQPAIRHRAGAT